MSRDEMVEALGTIARSGTKAFIDRVQEGKDRSTLGKAWEGGRAIARWTKRSERQDAT